MKVLILLCAFVLGSMASTLPEEEKIFLKQVHEKCQSKQTTHADETLLKNMEEHTHDPTVMAHMMCMAQGTGMMTPRGSLDMEVIKSKMIMVMHDQHHVEDMMSKCAVQKSSPMTTAMDMWMCFFHNNVGYKHTV